MMPTSDEVAAAIIAACRETGAKPIDVLQGAERESGVASHRKNGISRARAYAARALDRVFNRIELEVQRPTIAKLVGANKPSWGAFFTSLEGRPLAWWDEEAFHRVVDAVMECDPGGNTQNCPEEVREAEESEPDQGSEAEMVSPEPAQAPAPYKHVPPYRGPADLIQKVLEDDADDDAPVFDRGDLGGAKPRSAPVVKSKRQMDEDLAQAVRNTAAKTPPPEE